MRPSYNWRLRTRALLMGQRTLLMGIVNVTPDSFSDGGSFFTASAARDHALRLLDEGADIVDLGGESTRPNAKPLSASDEQARILPVVEAVLRARPSAVLSIDTYHAATAQAAIDAGAEIVNDVSGLLWDKAMPATLAALAPGAVLMHTRGRPQEWTALARLAKDEVVPLVLSGLRETLALAADAGIAQASIVLDPGFGFGKLGADNFTLLAGFAELHRLGYPLLAGLSRKRFFTAALPDADAATRLQATLAANADAIFAGAHILRVHDVAAARIAASVADAAVAAS